jgi:hypothetical protein
MRHSCLVSVALACLTSPALLHAQAAASEADTREVLAYQLTSATLQKVAGARRAMAAAAKTDPRHARIARLEAEKKQLEAKEEPTEAEQARLAELEADLAAAEEAETASVTDAKSLGELEARIQKEPGAAAALTAAGLTAREYAKFMLALVQASIVHGLQKSGVVKDLPKEEAAKLNMANVKWVAANEAEVSRLLGETGRD